MEEGLVDVSNGGEDFADVDEAKVEIMNEFPRAGVAQSPIEVRDWKSAPLDEIYGDFVAVPECEGI
jgi:hypothetical protein